MQVLILETCSSRILFQYDSDGRKRKEENQSKTEPEMIQLVTPILVSQKVFREELSEEVEEIQIGSKKVLISCHSYETYTLIVIGDVDKE